MPRPILPRPRGSRSFAAPGLILAASGFLLAGGIHVLALQDRLGTPDGPMGPPLAALPDPARLGRVFAIEPASGSARPPAEGPPMAETTPPTTLPSERMLAEIARRQAELDERDAALVERERMVDADAGEVADLLADLRRERENLQASIDDARDEDAAEIKRLVAIYEAMKPKDAARILDAMPADAVAGILRPMREARSAPILARMTPAHAFAVTVHLAGGSPDLATDRIARP